VRQPLFAPDGLVERALLYAATLEHTMVFSRQQAMNSLFSLVMAGVASVLDYNAERPDFALSQAVLEKFIAKQALLAVLWAVGGSLELQKREELATWIAQATTIPLPGNVSALYTRMSVSCPPDVSAAGRGFAHRLRGEHRGRRMGGVGAQGAIDGGIPRPFPNIYRLQLRMAMHS